jgi:phosphohistidine phosphatase SixA
MFGFARSVTLSGALSLVVVGALAVPAAADPGIVFIVRHAEKTSQTDKDPDISLAGSDRALSISRMLRATKLTHVFVTDLKRTGQTAMPAAAHHRLKPIVLPAGDTAGLVARLKALSKDAVVLVVGHGNTIPDVVSGLGAKDKVTIADDEYGRVFVVTPVEGGGKLLTELQMH